MEYFVDEMPKDCIECPFCQDIKVNAGMDRLLFCKANKGKAIKNIEKSFDKCIVKNEFQSLADYTKQVRKEVVEDIKERLKKANLEIMSPTDLYSYTDNFLYQVKKGRQIPG